MPRGAFYLGVGSLTCAALFAYVSSGARLEPPDFAFINPGEVASLDPAAVTGVAEMKLLRCLYEGLLTKDPRTLEPLPGIAERWELSPDAREYTFHLRRGALWSNGDPVTARDFVFSFERLLSPSNAAEYAYQLWYVRGAQAYTTDLDAEGRPAQAFDTVAIRAPDEWTLEIGLEFPTPFFLDILASVPLMPVNPRNLREMQARFPDTWRVEWLRPEHLVVDGPYRVALRRINDRIRFVKNESYWDARQVAFRTLDCLAVEHLNTSLSLVLTGAAGWCDNVPANVVRDLAGREDFRPAPYLGTGFYRFNTTRPPLDDARVRRALALAVDREAIAAHVLKAGEQPSWSCVPPAVRGYTPRSLRHAAAREQDLAEARALLAAAGFGPEGRSFPPIEILFASQSTNRDVAEVIADEWRRELGVGARLSNQEPRVALDSQRTLRYDVSRSSWIGDHPDALGFLELFHSRNVNNRTGWKNARYDAAIEAARRAEGEERTSALAAAEELLLEELPILPIWSFVTKNLVDPRLGGFFENSLDEHFPKHWYWKSDAELARDRASDPGRGRAVQAFGPARGLYAPAAELPR